MLDPTRLIAHRLLIDATVPTTRIEFSMFVSTQPMVVMHNGIRPVSWPGARQLVNAILTAPHGSRSGPAPCSCTLILHRTPKPVLVTTTYQVIVLLGPEQSFVRDCTGTLPFTETSFWQARLAGSTIATALVVALIAAPLAWTPPHWALTVVV